MRIIIFALLLLQFSLLAFSSSHIPPLIIHEDDDSDDAVGFVPVVPFRPSGVFGGVAGCGAICEDLSDYEDSMMFVVADERNFNVDAILAAGITDRVAVQYAPIIVHITSKGEDQVDPADDTSELKLIYTSDEGVARFDFNSYKTSCHEYKFMYCYSQLACGVSNCLALTGLDAADLGLGGSGDPFEVAITDIPLASGATVPVEPQVPIKVLSAFGNYKYCPPPPPIGGVMPPFCLPLVIILAFLMGALHLSGKNPFGMFDFSTARAGKHLRYVARSRGFGFDVAGIVKGLVTAGMATTESGRATLKADAAKSKAGGGLKAGIAAAGYGKALAAVEGLKNVSKAPSFTKMSLGELIKTAPSRFADTMKSLPSAGWDTLKNTVTGQALRGIFEAKDFISGLRSGLSYTSFAPLSELAFSIATAIKISGNVEQGIKDLYGMNIAKELGYKDSTTKEKQDAKTAEVTAANAEKNQKQGEVDQAQSNVNSAQTNVTEAEAAVAAAQQAVAAANEPGASEEQKNQAQAQLGQALQQSAAAQTQLAAAQDVLVIQQANLAAAQAKVELKTAELAVITVQFNIETNRVDVEQAQKELEKAKDKLEQAQENVTKLEEKATDAREQATIKADELAKAKEEGAPKTEIAALEKELKAAEAAATNAEATSVQATEAAKKVELTVQSAANTVADEAKQLKDAEGSLKGAQQNLETAQKTFETKVEIIQQKMDAVKEELKEDVSAALNQQKKLAEEREAAISASGNLEGLKKKAEEDIATASREITDATKELAKAKTPEEAIAAEMKFEAAKAAIGEAHIRLEGITLHGEAEIATIKAYDQVREKAGGTVAVITMDSSGKPVLTFYFVSSEEERQAALKGEGAAKGLTGRTISDWNSISGDEKKALDPAIQEALNMVRNAALTIQVNSYPGMAGLADKKEDTADALHELLGDKKLTGKAAELQRLVADADKEQRPDFKAQKIEQVIRMLSDPNNSGLLAEVGGSLDDKGKEALTGLRREAVGMRVFEQQAITANLLYERTGQLLDGNPGADKNMRGILESSAQALAYTGVVLGAVGDATEKVDAKKFDEFLGKSAKGFEQAETALSKVVMQSALYSANPNFDLSSVSIPDRPGVDERDFYLAATTLAGAAGTDKQKAERFEMIATTAEFMKENPLDAQNAALLLRGVATSITESSPDAAREMQKVWKDFMAASSDTRDTISARAVGLDAVGNMRDATQQVGLEGIGTGAIWSFREQLVAELEKRVEREPALQAIIDKLDTPSTAQREDLIAAVAQYGDNKKVDQFIMQNLEGDAKKEYQGLAQQVQNLEKKADEFSKDYKPDNPSPPQVDIVDRLKIEIISKPEEYNSLFAQRQELESLQEQIERERKEASPETGRGPLQIIKESMEKAEREIAEGGKPKPVEEQYMGHPLAQELTSPILSPTDYYRYEQPDFLGPKVGGMRYNPMTGRYERTE